jgi:hypothetical protein
MLVVCPVARNIVTVIIDCGSMGKLRGSETASPAFGMLMDVFPLNVTVWRVCGWIALTPAAPLAGSATVTAVMGKGVTPNALEKRSLICGPPTDMCKV